MTKRRRERDRPKSGPDAMYNPNKRVLLSYASDEEEPEDVVSSDAPENDADTPIDDRMLANYQMEEYPDSEDDAAGGARVDRNEDMLERDDESNQEEDEEDEKPSATQGTDQDPPTRRDAATNQWPTLGHVSYGEDEDEEYDPETEEAMAYLRAVKSERQTIPDILAAPRQLLADADHLQDITYHKPDAVHTEVDSGDAAYVTVQAALSEPTSNDADANADATDPQKVFTRLLLERFMEQRKQLHILPSMHKLSELPESCPISFPQNNNQAVAEWSRLLCAKPPLSAQLRSMDQDSVLNLLGLIQKQFLAKNCEIGNLMSAWIWSLLARLDDVGTMTNDEVFPIRELGKRAVFLLLSPKLAAGLATLEQEGLSVVPAKSGHAQSGPTIPMTENTLATLDMMIVVIGEAFGQRDLLEFRPIWSAPETNMIDAKRITTHILA